MENIQGWMVTAGVVVIAFFANLVDSRRSFTEKIKNNKTDIDEIKKEAADFVDNSDCNERRSVLHDDVQRMEKMVGATTVSMNDSFTRIHTRLDQIVKNGNK